MQIYQRGLRMKLTRFEIMELNQVLSTTNYVMPIKPQYRYMVTQNLKITKQEIDAVNEAFPLPSGTEEYKNKRVDIQNKFNIKSDKDLLELSDEDKAEYWTEISALDVEYKVLIEELKVYEAERMDFLKESIDIDLKSVRLADCPTISENNNYNDWDIWNVIEKIVEE